MKKLGIPLKEQLILAGVDGAEELTGAPRKVAVDAVFDSVSVGTTFRDELLKAGVIFLLYIGSNKRLPRSCKKISWLGCSSFGQLLCNIKFSRLF